MKLLAFVAAGLVAAAAITPTPSVAQPRHGWHGGGRWHWKTVCTTRWRHHRRVRVCRRVRTRW
ncbi:conserved exported hypothetical protein [Sphingomonas sp. EC-HK361]|uniref:hypothetical protein n=1 Tax=Sphingomonas sp. EC-HK361 TaxID=2038397 RepID=UPI00125748FC|nr:hypothetical protein [Sphingomonas sp. EC-HK361]VVS95829.1 conserved exported hypothetical protein [Sphingomonas sp. EC-HK361]